MMGWLVYALLNAVAGVWLRNLARRYNTPPRLEDKQEQQR